MFKEDQKQLYDSIRDVFGSDVLAMAAYGSKTIGLANQTSDTDYLVILGHDLCEAPLAYKIREYIDGKFWIRFNAISHTDVIDVLGVSINALSQECKNYCLTHGPKSYPSIVHRGPLKQSRQDKTIISNIWFDDYCRYAFYAIWLSDTNFFSQNILCNPEISAVFNPIDIADLFYTRAYGNFSNSIYGHEVVKIRKYAYTLHEILLCRWVLEKQCLPTMEIQGLLSILNDDDREVVSHIIDLNATSIEQKEFAKVEQIPEANHLITANLERIETDMHQGLDKGMRETLRYIPEKRKWETVC